MVRQALSDHSGHDQTQEPRCFTLYLVLLKGLYVVVLNSGPQAPELYRFLFQPGPGWRAQNCWLDFSFYCCCCCCCCSLRNSLCCRQTFFVSFSCWGLVLLARLDKEQRDICETCVGPCWTFDFEMKVALFSPGGATIRCHF